MTKIEKLENELKRCEAEIQNLYKKKKELEEKIKLEEQSAIFKMMKDRKMSFKDLERLLNK